MQWLRNALLKRNFVTNLLISRSKMDSVRPVFMKVIESNYGKKVAIKDKYGTHSYNELLHHSKTLSKQILSLAQHKGLAREDTNFLDNQKIAFLCSNTVTYTIMQWAVWMSGGVAVPLAKSHPENELCYTINDSESFLVLSDKEYSQKVSSLNGIKADHFSIDDTAFFKIKSNDKSLTGYIDYPRPVEESTVPEAIHDNWDTIPWSNNNAMLIYTSGTTGRPKGVVLTFLNLQTQLNAISQAWDVSHFDTSLHTLPLHHVHGVVNVLACSLWTGSTCRMLESFNPAKVWKELIENNDIDVFHGVPTMYALLIEHYESCPNLSKRTNEIRDTLRSKFRLMVSGSAALPEKILTKWKKISGHTLLERYGMSEVGMVLTNPLHGKRVAGSVGRPFPSVQIKIIGGDGEELLHGDHENLTAMKPPAPGELLVKGNSVFREYLNRPDATTESFTDDNWFKTGDTAIYDENEDVIRIMGRTSVDIIKTGGFKISALNIERCLLEHSLIKEAVAVGLDDTKWGQIVAVIVVLKSSSAHLILKELQVWLEKRLPAYSLPRKLMLMSSIPRNAMGKVNKKQLIAEHFSSH